MQAYCDHIEAVDEYAAMAQAKCDTVIGAFPGEHQMTCPDDDDACAECEGPKTGDDPELCASCAATSVTADAELIAAMEEL